MSASKWKPYPSYKDSDTFATRIPTHWNELALKRVSSINDDTLPEDTNPMREMCYVDIGSVSYENGINECEEMVFEKSPSRARRLANDGDVIVSTVRTYLKAICKIEKTTDEMVFSTGFAVVRPDNSWNKESIGDFIVADYFVENVVANSDGVSYPAINASDLGCLKIIQPPKKEQAQIKEFLGAKISSINSSISSLKALIELVERKRHSLIHTALLNGKIEYLRLVHVVEEIFRPIERIQTETYHPLGLYNRGRGIFIKPPTLGAELGDSKFFYVESDDLILSGQFAWEGAVALADKQHSGCVVSHRYPILRGKPDLLDSAYLQALFNTEYGDFILNQHSIGAAGRNRPLNIGSLLKEKIPMPPLEAQLEVSRLVYLEREMRIIFEKYTALLKEYRTALISAVVTGKIDVRESV